MIELYSYQRKMLNEIYTKFKHNNRIVAQLMTSGGKTVIFSFLSKWWVENNPTNVLILAHRSELIGQAEDSFQEISVGCEPIYAKTKPKHHSRIYISMIETAYNRLRKNPYFFKNIGLIIVDECHILSFHKVFDFFPGAKILGCTATPTVMKRITFYKCPYCRKSYETETECCDDVAQEWSKPFTLSEIYEDIVVGPSADELIEFGSIVREITFIKHYTDDTKLKTDADGEFTVESAEREYGNDNAAFNVLLNYRELCVGKKTLIFNPSAKANLAIYERFIEAGYENVRLFDSVNKEVSGDRETLLKWFANTSDAILLNVGIFTTGFNSREVEAIIINRPIGSLGLYIQIGGRGARSSKKIYKDNFILIDGGGNVDRFGELSDHRDWVKIFFTGNGKEKAKRQDAMDIHTCPECGCLYPKSENECPECGFIIPSTDTKQRPVVESEQVLVPIRKIPPPNGERIYAYTLSQDEDINFAFKIMINQIVDLFRFYRVSQDRYEKFKHNGKLDKKVSELVRKCYFVLLKKTDIQTAGRRTLANLIERTKLQLEKYYA